MTNVQARMLSAAIAMLAGGVAAGTVSNLGVGVLIVASAAWIAEYFRSQRA